MDWAQSMGQEPIYGGATPHGGGLAFVTFLDRTLVELLNIMPWGGLYPTSRVFIYLNC